MSGATTGRETRGVDPRIAAAVEASEAYLVAWMRERRAEITRERVEKRAARRARKALVDPDGRSP